MRRISQWVVAVLVLGGLLPSVASGQTKVGVVTTLEGTATATRSIAPRPLLLKFKDDVFLRDRIETAERSLARLLLGGKAVVTIREQSVLLITEVPGLATIDIESGKIGLAVARAKMAPGERIEIRTPTAIVGIRGTVIVGEVLRTRGPRGPAADPLVKFHVIGGEVDSWRFNAATGQRFEQGVVKAFESLEVSTARAVKGTFTRADLPGITAGLRAKSVTAPDAASKPAVNAQMSEAVTLVNALSSPDGSGPTLVTESPAAPPIVTLPPPTTNVGTLLGGGPVDCPPGTSSPGCQPPASSPVVQPSPPPPPPKPAANLLTNGGFEMGNFTGWTRSREAGGAVITNLGSRLPPDGSQFMALIHTGGAVGATTTTLRQSGPVGAEVFLIKFTYKFLSREFPDFFETGFNDTFTVRVLDPNENVTVLATETVDKAFGAPEAPDAKTSREFASAGGFTIDVGNGETEFKEISQLVASSSEGLGTLEFTIQDVGDSAFDSAALIDAVVVGLDPPLYLLRNGASLTRTHADPLEKFVGVRSTFDSFVVVCCDSTVSLAGPLLEAKDSDLTVPFTVLGVMQGGRFSSTTTDPLVTLEGGTHTLGTQLGVFDVAGRNTAVDSTTGLTLGTDTPLRTSGPLLEARGAEITTQRVLKVDTALLEASQPIVRLTAGSRLTSNGALLDLSKQASISALGPMVGLDQSVITLKDGPALRLADGSVVRTGDLFELRNASRLIVQNGPLVSVAGGSVLIVSGALVAFNGSGGNFVSVTNNLCPCSLFGGIPVALRDGASASNVAIGPGAIKNPSLGSIQLSPNAALISVSGPSSKVSIAGSPPAGVGR